MERGGIHNGYGKSPKNEIAGIRGKDEGGVDDKMVAGRGGKFEEDWDQ